MNNTCDCPDLEMLDDLEMLESGEVVDTYGGDYTYRNVFRCRDCKIIYICDYGVKPSFETLYEGDEEWERYWFMGY